MARVSSTTCPAALEAVTLGDALVPWADTKVPNGVV